MHPPDSEVPGACGIGHDPGAGGAHSKRIRQHHGERQGRQRDGQAGGEAEEPASPREFALTSRAQKTQASHQCASGECRTEAEPGNLQTQPVFRESLAQDEVLGREADRQLIERKADDPCGDRAEQQNAVRVDS